MARKRTPIQRVVDHYGGQTKAALAIGVSPQLVYWWQQKKRIPVHPTNWVLKIEELTGIPRHELRPDIYPAPAPETLTENVA